MVLKRVNLDTVGVRTDFLRSGTVARGAAESGKVRPLFSCHGLSCAVADACPVTARHVTSAAHSTQ